jgi:hypothetical protein
MPSPFELESWIGTTFPALPSSWWSQSERIVDFQVKLLIRKILNGEIPRLNGKISQRKTS